MKRVLFTGGRHFTTEYLVRRALGALDPSMHIIIHGAALGLDELAGRIASARGFRVESYPADWHTCDWEGVSGTKCWHKPMNYCPAAGPRRNKQMLESGIDLVYAFPGGRGTADMKAQAKSAGVRVVCWEYDDE